jgi:hypothetical protein
MVLGTSGGRGCWAASGAWMGEKKRGRSTEDTGITEDTKNKVEPSFEGSTLWFGFGASALDLAEDHREEHFQGHAGNGRLSDIRGHRVAKEGAGGGG